MLKKTFLVLLVLTFIPIGIWYIGIPDRWLSEKIESTLHLSNAIKVNDRPVDIKVSLDTLKKTPLFGFKVRQISIGDGGRVFVSLNEVNGRVDVLSIMLLRLGITLEGSLFGGRLSGNILIRMEGIEMTLDIDSLRIDEIDIPEISIFSNSKGLLKIRGLLNKGLNNQKASPVQGRVFVEINDMAFVDISSEGLYIPLSLFSHLKGILSINGGRMDIDALSMDGDNIYSRLKGTVSGDSFRGTLEIMPEPDFPRALLVVIQKYMHTPGYYVIPINTHISELAL